MRVIYRKSKYPELAHAEHYFDCLRDAKNFYNLMLRTSKDPARMVAPKRMVSVLVPESEMNRGKTNESIP